MDQNEETTRSLQLWLEDQRGMREKLVKHLTWLQSLKAHRARLAATPAADDGLDKAIARTQAGINEFEGSMAATEHLISLAQAGQLHDPNKG
jgi:hypothetical protein